MTRRSQILLLAGPLLLACVVVLGILWSRSAPPLPMRDFPEYWSAGRALLCDENPYDPETLLKYQRECEPDRPESMMMWNPPYAMPLVMLYAYLPPRPAQALWLLTQLAAVIASAAMLIRVYPHRGRGWLAAVAATAVFAPLFLLILYGQIGGFCLLGLAGFLHFESRQRFRTAGAFAALTALKPHLLFGFGLYLVLNATVSRGGRRVLAGGAMAIGAAAFLAWANDPTIYFKYIQALQAPADSYHQSVRDWAMPLLSYQLRTEFEADGVKRFWIQFVPTAVAALALVLVWLRRPLPVHWPVALPRLVFVSVLTAAYSGWLFDLVVLLVLVIQATAWLTAAGPPRRTAVVAIAAAFLLLNLGSSVGLTLASALFDLNFGVHQFLYFTPAVGLLYFFAARIASTSETS